MTGDLLQSDIELVRKLISEGQSDSAILTTLQFRKLAPDKAQQLVADLRGGVPVQADPVPIPHWEAATAGDMPRQEDKSRQIRSDRGHRDEPIASGFPWFRVALLLVIAISVTAIFVLSRRTPAVNAIAPPITPLNLASNISVEIQQGDLLVCGRPINRSNALMVLSDLLGPPSRTNRVENLNKIIYAYDTNGIVLFSDNDQNDSIVLYFERVGGANGAELPFTGTFKVHTNSLDVKTESKTLAAISQLNLSENPTNPILSGHCNGFNLSFAYLKTTDRLSLVQVDLQ
jgi:hypothetical protein